MTFSGFLLSLTHKQFKIENDLKHMKNDIPESSIVNIYSLGWRAALFELLSVLIWYTTH